jgi:hypothetical protein
MAAAAEIFFVMWIFLFITNCIIEHPNAEQNAD